MNSDKKNHLNLTQFEAMTILSILAAVKHNMYIPSLQSMQLVDELLSCILYVFHHIGFERVDCEKNCMNSTMHDYSHYTYGRFALTLYLVDYHVN